MSPLINTVRKRQLGWLGHTLRRDPAEPSKILALYTPADAHGKYRQGPRSLSYRHQIASLLSDSPKDLKNEHINEYAQDRDNWARLVADWPAIVIRPLEPVPKPVWHIRTGLDEAV